MGMPRVTFELPPGEVEQVPLLVGTASCKAELGYRLPLGSWGLAIDVNLGSRGVFETPILPFVVTA
jgi:hypothetical protein